MDVECFLALFCFASGSYLQKGQLIKGSTSIKDLKVIGDHKLRTNKYQKTPPEGPPDTPKGPSVHHLHYHKDLREKIVRLEYRVSHLTYQVCTLCTNISNAQV